MLFSLPGCALLLAPPVVRWVTGSRLTALAASVFVLLLTASAGHAYFSTFGHYAVTRTEYRAASMLEREVPGKAYLAPVSSYWPVRPTAEYANYRKRTEANAEVEKQRAPAATGIRSSDYISSLEEYLENRDAPTFLEFNSRMDAYADYRGIAQRGRIDYLRDALMSRDGWETIWDRGGVTVLRYVPARTADQPAARWQP